MEALTEMSHLVGVWLSNDKEAFISGLKPHIIQTPLLQRLCYGVNEWKLVIILNTFYVQGYAVMSGYFLIQICDPKSNIL